MSSRWAVRTVLALIAVALCVAAAVWQYQRAQDRVVLGEAAVAAIVPYSQAVSVSETDVTTENLGRRVEVTGTAIPGAVSFVRSRSGAAGDDGCYLVRGVRLDDGTAVAVLEGWVARCDQRAMPATAARIAVEGRIQPDENFYPSAPIAATGSLVTITHAGLAEQWGVADLAPGYVTAENPPAGVEPVRAVIGTDPDPGFPWQNATYAVQWLVFAGMVVFVWVRWLQTDLAREREEEESAPTKAPADRVSL